jgi:hypothetical protein
MRWERPATGPGQVHDLRTKAGRAAVNAHQQDLWSPRGQNRIMLQTARNQKPKAGSELAKLLNSKPSANRKKPRARQA